MKKILWLPICLVLQVASVSAQIQKEPSRLLPVAQDGKWGYIDRTGRVAIELQYSLAYPFSEGLAAVLTREGWAYIDQAGAVVIAPRREFFQVGNFSEGLAVAGCCGTKLGYINRAGQFVVKPQFEKAYEFSDGLARVFDDGKYGYIDKSGRIVFDLIFDDAQDFSGGIAAIKIGSRWGYIDRAGKYVWKPSK